MTHGLPPRPELAPDDLAALLTAAEEVLKDVTRRQIDRPPAWRFSGRWFNLGPYTMRRPYLS